MASGVEDASLVDVERSRSGEVIGAFELLNKAEGTFDSDDEDVLTELAGHAVIALENAQDRQQLISANRQITDQAADRVVMIGESPAIQALRSIVRRVADTDLAVLILGENGTGKEVVAQLIHYLSRRRDKPFIAVNCAAIPDTLAESELFGHEKGAFTDAREMRPGKFELAADGTLLLDEIGDMPPQSQLSLLRMLQEKSVRPVGGQDEIPVDVRVIAATNASLEQAVESDEFREDLFYRLDVIRLTIPPLRDRREDIVFLLGHFIRKLANHYQITPPQLSDEFLDAATSYDWPGNVRQLENFAERILLSVRRSRLAAKDFAKCMEIADESHEVVAPLPRPSADQPLPMRIDTGKSLAEHLEPLTREIEASYLTATLRTSAGRIQHAADVAGLSRRTLLRKLKQYGIDKRDFMIELESSVIWCCATARTALDIERSLRVDS